MKILHGELRGRPLPFKPVPGLRPTSDKVRQAVFNTLQGAVEGRRVLDLFSGTGALGFEALSLGAASVDFVESDRRQAGRIREAAEALGLKEKVRVVVGDAVRAVERWPAGGTFDLIFADPPYEEGWSEKILAALDRSSVLGGDSWIILECEKRESPPERTGSLRAEKTQVYGDSKILWYRR